MATPDVSVAVGCGGRRLVRQSRSPRETVANGTFRCDLGEHGASASLASSQLKGWVAFSNSHFGGALFARSSVMCIPTPAFAPQAPWRAARRRPTAPPKRRPRWPSRGLLRRSIRLAQTRPAHAHLRQVAQGRVDASRRESLRVSHFARLRFPSAPLISLSFLVPVGSLGPLNGPNGRSEGGEIRCQIRRASSPPRGCTPGSSRSSCVPSAA